MKKILAILLVTAVASTISAFNPRFEAFNGYDDSYHMNDREQLRHQMGKRVRERVHEFAKDKSSKIAERIADFANRLSQYEIQLDPDFVKEMQTLWANKADLHAKMALECAREAKDPNISQQFKEVAATLDLLSKQIRSIPAPTHEITKRFKHAVEMLALKAAQMRLKSKLFKKVYQQTGDKAARHKSKRLHKLANVFEQATDLAQNTI